VKTHHQPQHGDRAPAHFKAAAEVEADRLAHTPQEAL
jgi:hypothetical protein